MACKPLRGDHARNQQDSHQRLSSVERPAHSSNVIAAEAWPSIDYTASVFAPGATPSSAPYASGPVRKPDRAGLRHQVTRGMPPAMRFTPKTRNRTIITASL